MTNIITGIWYEQNKILNVLPAKCMHMKHTFHKFKLKYKFLISENI